MRFIKLYHYTTSVVIKAERSSNKNRHFYLNLSTHFFFLIFAHYHPTIQSVTRPEREAVGLPPSGDETKYVWSYTPVLHTPLCRGA